MFQANVVNKHTFYVQQLFPKMILYKYTLRICSMYCLSTATMVTQTHFNVTFVRRLPVLLMLPDSVADGHEKFLFLAGRNGDFFCRHVHAGLEAH